MPSGLSYTLCGRCKVGRVYDNLACIDCGLVLCEVCYVHGNVACTLVSNGKTREKWGMEKFYILSCKSCSGRCRMAYYQFGTRVGTFTYCPLCGADGIVLSLNMGGDTYWANLGTEYNLPTDIIKVAYDSWDKHEYANFSDYIKSLKEEVLSGTNSATVSD